MKKIYLAFLLCFAIPAWADFSISPFYLEFDASSPKRTDVVRFTNNSNEKTTYRIDFINYKQLEDGTYQSIQTPLEGNPFAAPYLNFAPHETTLEPGQSQTIRIQRKPMAAAPDGEYVSHLLVQEKQETSLPVASTPTKGLNIELKALYGVTIPIFIEKGKLTNSATIEKATLHSTGEQPTLEVIVHRKGTQSFWGTLIVKSNNTEIGRMNAFKIFLTTPRRLIKIPLQGKVKGPVQIILIDARTNEMLIQKTI